MGFDNNKKVVPKEEIDNNMDKEIPLNEIRALTEPPSKKKGPRKGPRKDNMDEEIPLNEIHALTEPPSSKKKEPKKRRSRVPPKISRPYTNESRQEPNYHIFRNKEDWLMVYTQIELNEEKNAPIIGFDKAIEASKNTKTEIIKASDQEYDERFLGKKINTKS